MGTDRTSAGARYGAAQIIAIGAPHRVLVEEATNAKVLMRLAESKGSMEFHPDLLKYYASNHGGLNEYRNLVWTRREGQDLTKHFKEDEDLSEDELADRRAKYPQVFTSALAQRLVMARLRRTAKYNPTDVMALANSKLRGGSAPDERLMGHIKNRSGVSGNRGHLHMHSKADAKATELGNPATSTCT